MARKTIITIVHTEADNGQAFTQVTMKGAKNFTLDELNQIVIKGKNDFFKTVIDQAKTDDTVLKNTPATIVKKKGKNDVN